MNPTQTAHTPAEWICPGTDGGEYVICTAQGKRRTVAHVYDKDHARLIAQAPAMLEALKKAHIMLLQTDWRNDDEAMNDIRLPIAAAEGKVGDK